MPDYGIDISHWNRVNDWNAVRGNNINFASVKLTEGVDWTDDAATAHVDGARGAGIHVGGYHFAHAGNVDKQVAHFTAQLRAHGLLGAGSLAPMLDLETAELRGDANAFTRAFITKLRATTGIRRVLVYANLDWWTHTLLPDVWADEDVFLWIARYNGDPGNPGWAHPRLAVHQHTNQGTVPGIPDHVDRNVTMRPFTLDQLTIRGGAPAPTPPRPAPKTHTVRPGDTLSEIAARYGTTTQTLARLNDIPNPDLIHPDQTIVLP